MLFLARKCLQQPTTTKITIVGALEIEAMAAFSNRLAVVVVVVVVEAFAAVVVVEREPGGPFEIPGCKLFGFSNVVVVVVPWRLVTWTGYVVVVRTTMTTFRQRWRRHFPIDDADAKSFVVDSVYSTDFVTA